LIVAGVILFFVIIGIIILICIKRKNRKRLENDFSYRPDKIEPVQFGSGLNGGDINTIDSKGLNQAYTSPYQQSQANASTTEVNGTYRSNTAYDNSDRSVSLSCHNENGYIIQKASRSLFEQEEYWRTNI
jgi:hypothetical protein